MSNYKQPTLFQSLIPICVLIGLLVVNVLQVFGNDALDGANQLALLIAATVGGIIALTNGMDFEKVMEGVNSSINSAMSAIIILLLIGALAGTWMLSGVVPAMIYYGLDILNPKIFLFATCTICSIVSMATGSSWSTVATVGIALLGIGKALGIGEPIIAGAIISGAYFGDKMSPLSDTTNLAPAMAGTDLFTHVKYMTYTTIPSILITLIIFLIIGLFYTAEAQGSQVEELQTAIASKFNVTPWLFVVPVVVISLILFKVPAIPALFFGSLLGGAFAILFQGQLINELFADSNVFKSSYKAVVNSMTTEVSIVTQNELVNELLSSGGMKGMLNTIWLILCAMIFGGVMEVSGMLKRITKSIIGLAKTDGSLIATTTASCIVFNVTASDQYLAIVVPGKMFAEEFKERNLHPKVLSRTLEDSGTVTSALVPWNTCGAYHTGVLGVATGDYFMYSFFNIISPIMTVIFGYFNIKIARINESKQKK
ncbi:MAG: Na+/H+ antiporter NhaC [Flavobacteriales bacterium]|nr:Na+/H+ antiporter NhaC [Flavobacteriales bacterium]